MQGLASPDMADLERMINRLVSDALEVAFIKKSEVISQFTRSGRPGNGSQVDEITRVTDEVLRPLIERTMSLTVEFHFEHNIGLKLPCDIARGSLSRFVNRLWEAERGPLGRRTAHDYNALTEAARSGQLDRVDEALKDLRIGYVGQRNVKGKSVRQQAMCLHRVLYTEIEKNGFEGGANPNVLGLQIGLENQQIAAAVGYLKKMKLVKSPYLHTSNLEITPQGMIEVDSSLENPDRPTPVMNIVNFHAQATGIAFQQGARSSMISGQLSSERLADFGAAVRTLEEVFRSGFGNVGEQGEALGAIKTIKPELDKPEPNCSAIKVAMNWLRGVAGRAVEGAVTAEAKAALKVAIDKAQAAWEAFQSSI